MAVASPGYRVRKAEKIPVKQMRRERWFMAACWLTSLCCVNLRINKHNRRKRFVKKSKQFLWRALIIKKDSYLCKSEIGLPIWLTKTIKI